jgi:MIP family channel proteins
VDESRLEENEEELPGGGPGDEAAEVQAAAAIANDPIPDRGPAAYVAEFIGTFSLVLFITLAVSEIARPPLTTAQLAQGAQPAFVDFLQIGFVHMFVLFFLVMTLAVVSGAHFNPAVTVSLMAIRQIKPIDAAIYVVVQFAGAILGALVTKLILTPHNFPNAKAVGYGAPTVSDALGGSTGLGMLVEGLGTFFLVFAIVGVAVNPAALREWAGFVIGGTLGLVAFVAAPLTGSAVNPARAFGPSLVAGGEPAGKFILVYVLAPLLGALIGSFAYMQMFILKGKKGPFGMGPVG